MNWIKRKIGYFIWMFCEAYKIDLGNYAPICFGRIVGSKGKCVWKGGGRDEN